MQTVKSLDEYYALVKTAKKERGAGVSNCFLFPDAVQRFIDLGRLYCEAFDAGVLFYSDEERYYEGYYYLNPDVPFRMEPKDKPVVVQNMRVGEEKKEKLLAVEKQLASNGFVFKDTMRQIHGEARTNLAKIEKLSKYARRELERDGFEICDLSEKWFGQIRELLDETPEIPYYIISYFTDEELKAQCDEGLIVGVVSPQGELCGVQRFFPVGKTLFGWVIVKEAYKQAYGMAVAMSEQSLRAAIEHGYSLAGWIDMKNEASIKYHLRKGNEFTNRYVDRWVLEA